MLASYLSLANIFINNWNSKIRQWILFYQ